MSLNWLSGLPELKLTQHRVIGSLKILGLSAILAVGLTANPAAAADPTFDFKAKINSAEVGPAGNSRTYMSTPAGFGVTATAFSSEAGTGPLRASYLGAYTPGLGVTNNVNGNSTSDNSHTVDNSGWVDFVVFQFSTALRAMSVSLSAFGDTDIQVWTGNLPAGYDFTNKNLSGLADITDQGLFAGGSSDRSVTLNFAAANYLIVAAYPSDRLGNDSFKIASFTVKAVPGPIAGAGIPSLLALAGFLFMRRRTVA